MIVLRLSGRGMLTSYASSPHEEIAAAIKAARKRFEDDQRIEVIEVLANGASVYALTNDRLTPDQPGAWAANSAG